LTCVLAPLAALAHTSPGLGHGSEVALAVVGVAAIVIPLIVLAVVGRAFWRAAERDEERSRSAPPPSASS
jgi:hypothetical protein